MGSWWSKTEAGLSPSDTERLIGETGFAKSHVTMLHLRFRELDRGDKGYLEREDLLRLTQVVNPKCICHCVHRHQPKVSP